MAIFHPTRTRRSFLDVRSTSGSRRPALDVSLAQVEGRPVNYDEFKRVFLDILRESRLSTIGHPPNEEVIDLRSTDRKLAVYVEPLDRDIGRPFHVSGKVAFRWSALQEARTRTSEEDLLAQVLGDDARDGETERPWLRIDISIRAGLEWGNGIPMPSPATWRKWSREVLGRLEESARLVGGDVVREDAHGHQVVLAWQGEPELKATCNALGELRLESISISAFQGIDLPRKWNDDEREPDEPPNEPLRAMFERLKVALHVWGEVMGHLRPAFPVTH